jgi:uncharacterized lipoprotein YddW (UPF0748 family)/DNA-binding beta-propeller fold protein YncE
MHKASIISLMVGGLLVMGLTAPAKNKPAKSVLPEARAVWVARYSYKSEEEVRVAIRKIRAVNCNLVVFQVRGNGTVLYPSKYEPWAEEVGSKDPGWDPLAVAIDECHKLGMQIHAWVNVYPGWRTSGTHPSPDQMYNAHPEWFMIDKTGESRGAEYAYVSPGIPEVQEHLFNVFMEIIKNYDVDGLHYDYIRYPGPNFSYDPVSIARFKKEFGKAPDELPDQWAQWRRDQITALVRRVYIEAMKVKPNLVISAAVWGSYPNGRKNYYQDSHQWVAEGIVDCLMPMSYVVDRDIYQRYNLQHRRNNHGRDIYMGIGAFIMRDQPELLVEQVELNRQMPETGVGNVIFDYRGLYGEESATPLGKFLIDKCYQEPVPLPVMKYKPTTQFVEHPYVFNVQSVPMPVNAGKPFNVICKIKNIPHNALVRLAWITSLKAKPKYIPMQELTLGKNEYATIAAVPEQKPDTEFECQVQVVQKNVGSKQEVVTGVSEWTVVPIRAGLANYVRISEFGQSAEGKWGSSFAPDGKLWSIAARKLIIQNPDGTEASFSPVTTAQDFAGKEIRLEPAGFAIGKYGIVYVTQSIRQERPVSESTSGGQLSTSTSTTQQQRRRGGGGAPTGGIVRLQAVNGKPLPALKLNFIPSRIALADNGTMFILESGKDVFHIIDAQGNEIDGSPILGKPGVQANKGIAVSADGNTVYILNGSDLKVHIWKGKITAKGAVYKKAGVLTTVSEFPELIACGPDGTVYVGDIAGERVKLFDKTGKRLGDIYQTKSEIITGIAFSQDGKIIYLVPISGAIQKWVKK